jgi:hypothetical protein
MAWTGNLNGLESPDREKLPELPKLPKLSSRPDFGK